jgi:GTP-binding protein
VDDFFLVDLPGYGFARAPKAVREAWRPLIEGFLRGPRSCSAWSSSSTRATTPRVDDLRMVEFLASVEIPTLFVLTKVDKLKATARAKRLGDTARQLGVEPDQVLAFSATSGEGREELLESLRHLLMGD